MPNGGSITGYLFADFDFVNDNNQLVPSQNGPFSLPSNAQGTLAAGATTLDINVLDDDMEFDDGFQDDPNGTPLNQILRDDIDTVDASGAPVFVGAGAVLEVEFTLTAVPVGGGDPIDLLFVAAGPGENQGDLTMVVSTAPLVPGTTYDISFKNDGGGTPYGELVCFARGSRILTPGGLVPVETLRVGDLVSTLDSGPQPIVWMARRSILFPTAEDRPVRIAAGAFGPAEPFADLDVSPRHALVQSDAINRVLFDSDEVLVAARDCVDGVRVTEPEHVSVIEYHHFMFASHEIVFANGMPSESFFPGPVARRALEPAALASLVALYPSLQDPSAEAPFEPARRHVRGYERRVARSYAPARTGADTETEARAHDAA